MNLTTGTNEHMQAFNVAITAVCAALYVVVGYITSLGLTFGGVAFWPAAVVPAIFAVLFGPWVGAVGASIGIFTRDMLFHGNALLSLTAGVTGNFVAFFLIGYLARTDLSRIKLSFAAVIGGISIVGGLLLPTFLLPTESIGYTQWSIELTVAVFVALSIFTLIGLVLFIRKWPGWRNFAVATLIGQGVGGAVLTLGVWGYSQLFFGQGAYFTSPVPASFAPVIFVWTFATEVPFVLMVGPPIIKVCYWAFPMLRERRDSKAKT